MSLRNTFVNTLYEVGVQDENLIVLVGDISHFRLQQFAKDCPGRYYNIGICENTILSMAAGLSLLGFCPVVHTIEPFLIERSFEQIKLDFGYQKLGVNIVVVGSAFDYADLGCTHHCYGDFAMMKTIQDSNIIYPASEIEFNTLFKQTYNNGKINLFRITSYTHDFAFAPQDIRFGKAILVKQGKDLTIVTVGPQLKTAIDSLEQLQKLNLSPEIIYMPTIKPFDAKLVNESLAKTNRCLVIEEHSMYGGVFDDVLRFSKDLDGIKYASINIGDKFIYQYGTYQQHCNRLGFSVEGIVKKVTDELL
jgi:transketolase